MKLIIIIFAFITLNAFGQQDSSKIGKYVSFGLSTSNGSKISNDSYYSLEFGLYHKDVSYGLALGRSNFNEIFKNENISNYFYEVKVAPSLPLGYLTTFLTLGFGGYFNTTHHFIEYGGGVSHTFQYLTYSVSYSNWDTIDYINLGVSYNF